MKNFLLFVLVLGFVGEMIVLFSMYKKGEQTKVLGENIAPTITSSPTPSPTFLPTPSPTSSPTATPTITPIPQPTSTSEQINEFINSFASEYGVSPDILRHLAICESGFNPSALKLSYAGLFQFGPSTWKNIRTEMEEETDVNLRLNAKEAVKTAAYVLHVNKAYIWPNCTP